MAMRIKALALALLLAAPFAAAQAPVCLFQDILSGPVAGQSGSGEGSQGIYITLFGLNLGSSGTITVNGTAPYQTFNWGAADQTGNYQTIGLQVASTTTGTGAVSVTNGSGTCQYSTATISSLAVLSGVATVIYTGPQVLTNQILRVTGLTSTAGKAIDGTNIQVLSGSTSTTFTFNAPGVANQVAVSDSGTASNGGFTARSGTIWYIGPRTTYPASDGIDTDNPGTTCSTIKSGTAGGGAGGNGTFATPWKLTNASNVMNYPLLVLTSGGTSGYTAGAITTSGGHGTGFHFTLTAGAINGSGQITEAPLSVSNGSGYLVGDVVTILEAGSSNDATMTLLGYPESLYTYGTQRTLFSYYRCIGTGDALIFLNGLNFEEGDGYQSTSLTANSGGSATSSSFHIFKVRPGDTVQIGSGDVTEGLDFVNEPYAQVGLEGATVEGGLYSGLAVDLTASPQRLVGGVLTCPTCQGQTGTLQFGSSSAVYGVAFNNISTAIPQSAGNPAGPNLPANKEYHCAYGGASAGLNLGYDFEYNRIWGNKCYNGLQLNSPTYQANVTVANNDFADAYGACLNMTALDLSLGFDLIYNNVFHHCGVGPSSDGGASGNHAAITFPENDNATGPAGPGTVYVYNNTMSDCSYYLNSVSLPTDNCVNASLNSAMGLITINISNNNFWVPAYAQLSTNNPYIYTAAPTLMTGLNNLFYSATTPSCGTTGCLPVGGSVTGSVFSNPLAVNAPTLTDTAWTAMNLTSTSPGIGAGATSLYPTTDFVSYTRPSPPAIGALEYQSASSFTLTTGTAGSGTLGCTPTGSVTSGATVNCTATAGTGYSFSSFSTNSCGFTATSNTTTGTMPAFNCSLIATFTINSYTLTVTSPTNGTITGTNCASGSIVYGTSITCQATPSAGYVFTGWSGGTITGLTNPQTFSKGAASETVTATFALPSANLVLSGGITW